MDSDMKLRCELIYERWIQYGADCDMDQDLLDLIEDMLVVCPDEHLSDLYDGYSMHMEEYGSDDGLFKEIILYVLTLF
jgi:hypothetical protein